MTFGFDRERASSRLGRDQYVTTMNLAANLKTKNNRRKRAAGSKCRLLPIFQASGNGALFKKTPPSRWKEKRLFLSPSFHLNRCIDNQKEEGGKSTIQWQRGGNYRSTGRDVHHRRELSVSASLCYCLLLRDIHSTVCLFRLAEANRSRRCIIIGSLSCWLKLFYPFNSHKKE